MARIFLVALVLIGAAAGANAQTVITSVEQLTFDRPESWALQYFTSATLLTGLDTAQDERAGSITIGLETGWVPSLTPAQQRVGFSGTALQDLNKAPIVVRPRVRVGLPGRFALMAAGMPPIRAFGVTPRLFALALDWAMIDGDEWRVAWRAHGQTGTVTGAFSCPASVTAFPPGSPANPTGCEAESADAATLRYGGIEVETARRIARLSGLTPHVAVGVNAIAARYQVNARAFGDIDHTLLETSGVTWSASAGAALPINSHVTLSADMFYTPLMVRRTATAPRTNEGLFNVRALISYRLVR
jgi:hypothetical protein